MRKKVACSLPGHPEFFIEPGQPVACPACERKFPVGVLIHGNVVIGERVSIGSPADVNGKDSSIFIGDDCDIASFATVSCADSHRRCLGLSPSIERKPIVLENNVFVGQGAKILGGCHIGHHTTIGAGVVLKNAKIPPYSRVMVPDAIVEAGFYERP